MSRTIVIADLLGRLGDQPDCRIVIEDHPHDQVATEGPAIIEKEMQVDEDAWVQAMTFNGAVPGPRMVVHEGDYVELPLFNPPENMMQHNIDFHAATGALGGGSLTLVNPGEKAVLRLKASSAIAGTRGAAHALARHGGGIVPDGKLAAGIGPVPVSALWVDHDTAAALARLGLSHIADLARQPRAPVAALRAGAGDATGSGAGGTGRAGGRRT